MAMNGLTRFIARVVLISYSFQIFAPIIHAMEVAEITTGPSSLRDSSPRQERFLQDSLQKMMQAQADATYSGWKNLALPSHKEYDKAASIIKSYKQQDTLGAPQSNQARDFQYRISIKAINDKEERLKFKLSRKLKKSDGPFEHLHKATILQDKLLTNTDSSGDGIEDELLSLFKGGIVNRFMDHGKTICYSWSIPGVGLIKVAKDGTLVLDQDHSVRFLSSYDLVLQTSKDLLIQNLTVASLTLQAPRTELLGDVQVNHLHMNHKVINEGVDGRPLGIDKPGGLRVGKLTGTGTLTNHGTLELDGTEQNPAVVGVHSVINEVSSTETKPALIKGAHVHVTPENKTFTNQEGAEVKLKGKLLVDDSQGKFINDGMVHIEVGQFNRETINSATWTVNNLTVDGKPFTNTNLGTLTVKHKMAIDGHLLNVGDLIVGQHLKVKSGVNKGSIKGDNLALEVTQELINEKFVGIKSLSGSGIFINHKNLEFLGNASDISIRKLVSQSKLKDAKALILGGALQFSSQCESFVNDTDSRIEVDALIFQGEDTIPEFEMPLDLDRTPKPFFQNKGYVAVGSLNTNGRSVHNLGKITLKSQLETRGFFANKGSLETGLFTIHDGKFVNLEEGGLTIRGDLNLTQGTFHNAGTMEVNGKTDIAGSLQTRTPLKQKDSAYAFYNQGKMTTRGKYTQKLGTFNNTGTWEHQGDIDLGLTIMTNQGTMSWREGRWDFSPTNSTNHPTVFENHGNWEIDKMRSAHFVNITNHKLLHLKGGYIGFGDFINRDEVIVSSGAYTFHNSLVSVGKSFCESYLIKLMNVNWIFEECRDGIYSLYTHSDLDAYFDSIISRPSKSPSFARIFSKITLVNEPTVERKVLSTKKSTAQQVDTPVDIDDLFDSLINGSSKSKQPTSAYLLSAVTVSRISSTPKSQASSAKKPTVQHKDKHEDMDELLYSIIGSSPKPKQTAKPNSTNVTNKKAEEPRTDNLDAFLESFINPRLNFPSNLSGKSSTTAAENRPYLQLGSIQCEKSLTYDAKILPQIISVNGDVHFTKRFEKGRDLAHLATRIWTPGKVVFYMGESGYPTVTSYNYDFKNIGHVHLYINDSIKVLHELKAPTLTLDVTGDVICGESNDKMGSIASTKGPLNIVGHKLDVRFGKISSKGGATTLTATKGNVLIGAPRSISKGSPFSVSSLDGWGGGMPPQTGPYNFNLQNGAYVASEYELAINSPNQILVDYGKLMSSGIQRLKAGQLVRNKSSSFQSLNNVIIESPKYWHTRDSIISNPAPSDANHIIIQDVPGSDPASIEALGNIELYVNQIHNIGSLMFGDNIWIKGQKFNPKSPPSGYFEESQIFYNREWTYQYYWQAGCVVRWLVSPIPIAYIEKPNLLGKKDIQLLLANFLITGRSDANNFKIVGLGLGAFKGLQNKPHVVPKPIQFNLTKIIDGQVSDTGFIRRSPTHEIYSEVFSIRPTVFNANKKIPMLETANNRHLYRDGIVHLRFINPLNRLHSGLYSLYLRQTMAKLAGSIRYENVDEWFQNGIEFSRELGKQIISQSDLKKATREMLFHSLREEEGIIYEDTEGYIPESKVDHSQGLTSNTIDIRMNGDLSVTDYQMTSKTFTNLFSEEHLAFLSTTTLQAFANGTQEVIYSPTEVESTQGSITALGKKGFTMTATKLKAMLRIIAGSTQGDTTIQDVQLKRTEHFSQEEDGGMFEGKTSTHTTQVTSTAKSSEVESTADKVTIISGKDGKTSIAGSMLKSIAAVIFEGKIVETHASAGIDSVTTNTTTEGSFTTSQSKSVKQSANFNPTTVIAPEVHIKTKEASYRGTDFLADVIYDNTKEGASFGPTTTWLEYFQQTISESPLLTSDVGIKGGYETMYPCHMMVNKIVRNINDGEIKFESVDWDKDRTEIIGKLAETTYRLKSWQTSWANVEQVIPDEALVVVALGIAIATQGTGASWAQGFLTSTFGTVPTITAAGTIAMVPAVTLTTTGAAMASAGLTALLTQAATSFLKTGDHIATGKSVLSTESLKSIGFSVASAGLFSKLGSIWKIDMNPSLKEVLNLDNPVKPVFTDFLKSQALKCGIDAGLNVTINGADPTQALASALKQAPLAAAAAWASYTIGDLGFTGKITSEQQDMLHTVLGATYGSVLNPDRPLEGALSGAANAFIAARASKMMFGSTEDLKEQAKAQLHEEGRPVTKDNIKMVANDILHTKTAISTIISAAATAAVTKDVKLTSTGIATATNVTENNCIPSMAKSMLVAEYQPTIIQEKEGFWKDELDDPYYDYYLLANEEAQGYKPPSYLNLAYVDEDILATNIELKDPNLSIWERLSLNSYLEGQRSIRSNMATVESLGTKIEWLDGFKTWYEDRAERKLIYSVHNASNRNAPIWQRYYSLFSAPTYYYQSLGASFIPVTYGDVATTIAPMARPIVKTFQAIHPARLFSWAARMVRTSVVPIQKMKMLPAPKMVKHHIFPQQFGKFFESKGINIHEYTVAIGETNHLKNIHGLGNHSVPGKWNQRWKQFIDTKPNANPKEIYQFAGTLMDEYNLSHIPLQGYK